MDSTLIFGAWLSAFFTLSIFSMLYRDNFFFKLAENIFIGITLGYYAITYIFGPLQDNFYNKVFKAEDLGYKLYESIVAIIAFLSGMLIFTRFIPKLQWLSRWTMAFLLGYTAGFAIPTAIDTFLLKQASDTIRPLNFNIQSFHEFLILFETILIVLGVITVLLYFFFSSEQKGMMKWGSGLGLAFIVIFLGSLYGNTTMGRLSLVYGRFYDLVDYTASKYYYCTYVLLAVFIVFFVITARKTNRKSSLSSQGSQS